jgi:hypothetical protein
MEIVLAVVFAFGAWSISHSLMEIARQLYALRMDGITKTPDAEAADVFDENEEDDTL